MSRRTTPRQPFNHTSLLLYSQPLTHRTMSAPLTLEQYASADLPAVLASLTLAEKVSLLAGADWWNTVPIPRVGVPKVKCSDGPNGVRGSSHFNPTPATCIPSATALGATFDVGLIGEVGGLLARECKAKGSSFLLGPTCNIQRSPLNGRVSSHHLTPTQLQARPS